MPIKLTCLYLCIIKNENAMKTQKFEIGTKFMTELGLYVVTARAIMAQKWVVQNEKNLGNNNYTLYSERELVQMLELGKIKLV